MKFTVRAFLTHRLGDADSDCQDSLYAEEDSSDRIFAVSDGTTNSFFSRLWARQLTKSFGENPEKALVKDAWKEWLLEAQQKWRTEVEALANAPQASVFTRNGFNGRQPAAATFVGLRLGDTDGKSVPWDAVILGDSCLFHLRAKRYDHFPELKAEEFSYIVDGVNSFPVDNGSQPQFLAATNAESAGNTPAAAVEGDVIVLATDAVSQWILRREESGVPAWGHILNLKTPEEFEEFVASARGEENMSMVNDDIALVIIEFGEPHSVYARQKYIPVRAPRSSNREPAPCASPVLAAQPPVAFDISPASPSPAAPPPAQNVRDDDVQFTVYRPQTMPPAEWQTWLAFAHRGTVRAGEPDHGKEVEVQARAALGAKFDNYAQARQESGASLPRETAITIVPQVEGLEFSPAQRNFVWSEPVHREEFLARAAAATEGQVLRGKVTFFLGAMIIAEINVKVSVTSAGVAATAGDVPQTRDAAQAYRKIFVSYSRQDSAIVDHFEQLVAVFGDRYLRDIRTLRAGEEWGPGLERMIREADVFQLFWSTHAMRSKFVRQECEFALRLGRSNFIRPTYWEKPFPEDSAADLPSAALRALHFAPLPFIVPSSETKSQPPLPVKAKDGGGDAFEKIIAGDVNRPTRTLTEKAAAPKKETPRITLPAEGGKPAMPKATIKMSQTQPLFKAPAASSIQPAPTMSCSAPPGSPQRSSGCLKLVLFVTGAIVLAAFVFWLVVRFAR